MDLTEVARFHVAPGYDPADPDTWVWEDRSADVDHVDGGIRIRGGRADEISQVEAGSATLRVDNADGHYCTENPLGRWYGLLAEGCPARWGTISGAAAFDTAAASGLGDPDVGTAWAYTPGTSADWSVSGGTARKVMASTSTAHSALLTGADARNGDATMVIMAPSVATGGPLTYGFQARYTDTSDHLHYTVDLDTGGTVVARIRRQYGGSLTTLASATLGWTYSASQRIAVRVQWDGPRLRMRVWPEADDQPTTWDVLADDSVCAGAEVGIRAWRSSGNTNVSPVFHFDDLEVLAVEIVGTIDAWPVEWDPTAAVSWASIQISGIVRRLGLNGDPLTSPIRGQLRAQSPWAYWPLEEPSTATAAGSAVNLGRLAVLTGVTLGSTSDRPDGASAAATLTTAVTSRIAGWITPTRFPPGGGFAAMFYCRMPTLPGSAQTLFEVQGQGTATRWLVQATATGFTLSAYDAVGSTVVAASSENYSISDPTDWFAIQLETEESGGTVTWTLIWHQVGDTVWYFDTGSFAGSVRWTAGMIVSAPVNGTLVSHMWIGPDNLQFVDSTFQLVSSGYAGEAAADRVDRLCTQAGVPTAIESGDSEPLGPQQPGALLPGLRAAEAGDMGILYEAGAYVGYRPRGARYSQPTWMTVAIDTDGDVGAPPRPVSDDQRLRNSWTVRRELGGEATAEDDDSIARSGRRPDSVTINIDSPDRLADHAAFRVRHGIHREYRWPSLDLDFTDNPAQLALWRGRPHAPRITLTGVPSQGPIGRDPELIVEGWDQTITSHSWHVTASCSPARPWDVAVVDDSDVGIDTDGSELAADVDADDTTWSVAVTDGPLWTTDAGEFPFDVNAGGIRVTVTAISGTSSPQTWTVVRSVNGFDKAMAAGTAVALWEPSYIGL